MTQAITTLQPFLVGRKEAARLLGISVPTLDRRTAANKIPSVKDEGRRMYHVESLRRYAESLVNHNQDPES